MEIAVEKALGFVNSLPQCRTVFEAQDAILAIQGGRLPGCTDSNLPVDLFIGQLEGQLSSEVIQSIAAQFPSSVTYDESLFTSALGGQGASDLESIRDQIADGITIDADDILDQLSDQDDTAQRFLEIIRTGRSFTVDDFDRYRDERAIAEGQDDLEDVDTIRGAVGLALGELGAALAIAGGLLILFIIGVLGGRTWTSRLIWAASALVFAALIVWLAFAQILSGYGADFAEEELLDEIDAQIAIERAQGDPTGMLELARDEGVTKVRAFGDAVSGEFSGYAVIWLFAGVIAILAGIAIRVSRGSKPPKPADLASFNS